MTSRWRRHRSPLLKLPSRREEISPISREHGAADVVGGGGDEEPQDPGHLFRLAEPRYLLAASSRVPAGPDLRVDEAQRGNL